MSPACGNRSLVVLESPARVELQQEVTALGIDQECRVARLETSSKMVIAEMMRPRTIEITMTQMMIWVTLLLLHSG